MFRGRQRESRRWFKSDPVADTGGKKEKKNALPSYSEKKSWTKNLLQLLEMSASRKIKKSCVLFHKAYIYEDSVIWELKAPAHRAVLNQCKCR